MTLQTHRRRAPPSGTYARLAAAQREAQTTGTGDAYLHVCVLGEVAPYLWRATAAVERFTCGRCGVCGVCVACIEEQGTSLPTRVVPVLCRRHGGLEREEGVALAVGERLSALQRSNNEDAAASHWQHVEQAALFG